MPNNTATAESPRAGLNAKTAAIPLEGVSVEADLKDFSARVVVTQRYRNIEDRAVEAVYTFPLDEQAAVCGFEAVVGGVHYAAQVMPREKAFAEYDDALIEGHGAYLLDEERPDVFVASVGNIPPNGEALLRITYVTELVADGNAVRFTLPTTVAPRYAPAEDRAGVGPAGGGDAEPAGDVERALRPRSRDSSRDAWANYGDPVARRIRSPSRSTACAPSSRSRKQSAALDRDVVVLIEAQRLHDPHVRVERDETGH